MLATRENNPAFEELRVKAGAILDKAPDNMEFDMLEYFLPGMLEPEEWTIAVSKWCYASVMKIAILLDIHSNLDAVMGNFYESC